MFCRLMTRSYDNRILSQKLKSGRNASRAWQLAFTENIFLTFSILQYQYVEYNNWHMPDTNVKTVVKKTKV